MPKRILILAMLILLAACQSNEGSIKGDMDAANHEPVTEQEAFVNVNEGKKEKPLEEIKEKTLYQWSTDSQTVYVTQADGEVKQHEFTSAHGLEGDSYFAGDVELYLVYEEDNVGYLQKSIEAVRINLENFNVDKFVIGDDRFFGWITPESTNIYQLFLFVLKDGQVESVTIDGHDEFYTSTRTMKVIEDRYVQKYTYINHTDEDGRGLGWHFHTYEWDRTDNNFILKTTRSYTDESWNLGEEIVKDWHEEADFYVNYGQYTMAQQEIDLMKEGKLLIEEITLGDSIEEVLDQKGKPSGEFYERGAPLYTFEDQLSYTYDEVEKDLITISLAGSALSNDLANLYQLLGEPTSDEFWDYFNAYVAVFNLGSYELNIYYDDDDEIDLIELSHRQ